MSTWIKADSAAISGFRYDEAGHVLRVKFKTGSIYDYFKATPKIVERLMTAPSKGQYFTSHIRDKLAFRRVK